MAIDVTSNHELYKKLNEFSISKIKISLDEKDDINRDFINSGYTEFDIYLCDCTAKQYVESYTDEYQINYIGKGLSSFLGLNINTSTNLYDLAVIHPKYFDEAVKKFSFDSDVIIDIKAEKIFLFRREK